MATTHPRLLTLYQPFLRQVSRPEPHQPSHTQSRQSKQDLELIEQPIPTVTGTQPMIMDSTPYAAIYNNSASISPSSPEIKHTKVPIEQSGVTVTVVLLLIGRTHLHTISESECR